MRSQSKHCTAGGVSTTVVSVSQNPSQQHSCKRLTNELTSSIEMLQSEAMMVLLCLPKVGGMDCINLMPLTTAPRPYVATPISLSRTGPIRSYISHSSKESTADLTIAQASLTEVKVVFRLLDFRSS